MASVYGTKELASIAFTAQKGSSQAFKIEHTIVHFV